jgi:hypothetical protein
MTATMDKIQIIGQTTKVTFPDYVKDVPAKVDTGAYRSSLWATSIYVDKNNVLHFTPFAPGSNYFTGKELTKKQFSVCVVRNSTGHEEIRYQVKLSIYIEGRRVLASFNLSDRSRNKYPILIGCKLIRNKFLVDVSKGDKLERAEINQSLDKELAKNPYDFFIKYFKKDLS